MCEEVVVWAIRNSTRGTKKFQQLFQTQTIYQYGHWSSVIV
jgi:hypothetical protein